MFFICCSRDTLIQHFSSNVSVSGCSLWLWLLGWKRPWRQPLLYSCEYLRYQKHRSHISVTLLYIYCFLTGFAQVQSAINGSLFKKFVHKFSPDENISFVAWNFLNLSPSFGTNVDVNPFLQHLNAISQLLSRDIFQEQKKEIFCFTCYSCRERGPRPWSSCFKLMLSVTWIKRDFLSYILCAQVNRPQTWFHPSIHTTHASTHVHCAHRACLDFLKQIML